MTSVVQDAKVVEEKPTGSESRSPLEQILDATKLRKGEDAYDLAKVGLRALIKSSTPVARVDKALIDARVAEIDQALSKLTDAVVHHVEFQKHESAWRGLKDLVQRTDFRENIRLKVLNVSKDDLLADFEDASETVKSGLYRIVYSNEYGTLGGKPYGAVLANYEFGPGPQDMLLLEKASAVAAMAHCPFISATSPEMFGVNDTMGIARMKDIASHFEGRRYAQWRALRDNPDTTVAGLLTRRNMLRLPYGTKTVPAKSFNYEESIDQHEDYLWGNDVFMFGSRLTESFAKFRWCVHIIGKQAGGAVDGLPLHVYEEKGAPRIKVPTEIALSDRLEFELAEAGFIAPVYEKDSDTAVFYSANSIHRPKEFAKTPEGQQAQTNYALGTQLPYMFSATRIAHYLKVMGREMIGLSIGRAEIQRRMNDWIGQYVADTEAPTSALIGMRPFRKAEVTVTEVEGEPGWYRYKVALVPQRKNMGGSFELSLVGKLEREAA